LLREKYLRVVIPAFAFRECPGMTVAEISAEQGSPASTISVRQAAEMAV
jgi:hypothetical protein